MDHVRIDDKLSIPQAELRFSFERSSGPGGQHVNKVNTSVELRLDLAASTALNDDQRRRLTANLQRRLVRGNVLVVRSSRYRSQARNRQDCVEKMIHLMAEALVPPPPPRRRTRPSRAAVARRLQTKKLHAVKKSRRRRPGHD